MVEIDPEELERQRKEAAYQAELKKYGVSKLQLFCALRVVAYLGLGGVLRGHRFE